MNHPTLSVTSTVPRTERECGKKILLIMPPPWGVQSPPIAPYLLKSVLDRVGRKSEVFDLNQRLYQLVAQKDRGLWDLGASTYWLNGDFCQRLTGLPGFEGILEDLLGSDADLFGFSIYSSNIVFTTNLIDALRKRGWNRKIVFGGPGIMINNQGNRQKYPLYVGNFRFDDPYAGFDQAIADLYGLCDFFVFGEGEETLPALLEAVDRDDGTTPDGTFFSSNAGRAEFIPRKAVERLDDLPFPDYRSIDFADRTNSFGYIHVFGSRGCVRRCRFCTEKRLWTGFRTRTADHIYRELLHHYRNNGVATFGFVDLLINGHLKTLERLCLLIEQSELSLQLDANMIVHPRMDEIFFDRLKNAGFIRLRVGIESGSDRILKAMNKGFSSSQAARFLAGAKKAGIEVSVNFILGFPGETEDDFLLTLKFLDENHSFIGSIGVLDLLILYRDSELFEDRDDLGITLTNPSPKMGAFEHWQDKETGDYVDRFERLIRFTERCRRYRLPYPHKNARQIGDIERILGEEFRNTHARKVRIEKVEADLAGQNWSLGPSQQNGERLLELYYLRYGTLEEKETCFNQALISFDPEEKEFYHLIFSEKYFPLDFCQFSSKETLFYTARRFQKRFAEHLIALLSCSDDYIRFVAAEALKFCDYGLSLIHLYKILRDETFNTYPDPVKLAFSEEKQLHDAWISGDPSAYFGSAYWNEAGSVEAIERIRNLFSATIGADPCRSWSDYLLLATYLDADDLAKECCLRFLLKNFDGSSYPLLAIILDEHLGPLPHLTQFTLELLTDLAGRFGQGFEPVLLQLAGSTQKAVRSYFLRQRLARSSETDLIGKTAIAGGLIESDDSQRRLVEILGSPDQTRSFYIFLFDLQLTGLHPLFKDHDPILQPALPFSPGQPLDLFFPSKQAPAKIFLAIIANQRFPLYQTILHLEKPRTTRNCTGYAIRLEEMNFLRSVPSDRLALLLGAINEGGADEPFGTKTIQSLEPVQKMEDGGGYIFSPGRLQVERKREGFHEPGMADIIFKPVGESSFGYGQQAELTVDLYIPRCPRPLFRVQIFDRNDHQRSLLLFGMNNFRQNIEIPCARSITVILRIDHLNLCAGIYRLIVEVRDGEAEDALHLVPSKYRIFEVPALSESILKTPGYVGMIEQT